MASDGIVAKGVWHPQGSNAAIPSELRKEGIYLKVISREHGAVIRTAPCENVNVSPRVGRIPRRLDFPGGGTLVTEDNDAIDAWLRSRGVKGWAFVHELERFRLRLGVFVLAVALAVTGIYRYGVPVLVEVAVRLTPPVVVKTISSGSLKTMERTLLFEKLVAGCTTGSYPRRIPRACWPHRPGCAGL